MGGKVLEHEGKTIYNEGFNKGKQEGKREGEMEAKQSIAMRLCNMDLKVEDIAKAVDVSINLVRQWISIPIDAGDPVALGRMQETATPH